MASGQVPGGRHRPSLATRPPTDQEITAARLAVAANICGAVEGRLAQIHACAELLEMLGLLPDQLAELVRVRSGVYNNNSRACVSSRAQG